MSGNAILRAVMTEYYGGACPPIVAYEYDINSAYPAAMQELPNLKRGRWVHNDGTLPLASHYAVIHARATANDPTVPGPLFRRDAKGCIIYPTVVTGWYWRPEYDAAQRYADAGHGTLNMIEAWEFFEDDKTDRPFSFVPELFYQRQLLKAAKNGAHVGIKLGLNSLYGKLAQQLGWELKIERFPIPPYEAKTLHIPPFHQLEWAGYVTSWCRARILDAALTDLTAIIAFETDALFSMRPLPLNVGTGLGEWEQTLFTDLTYLQSGLYFGTKFDPKTGEMEVIAKTRGVDRCKCDGECVCAALTLEKVLKPLANNNAADRIAEASLTRFVGVGVALAQNRFAHWRHWEKVPKKIKLEPQGKRAHLGCEHDSEEQTITFGEWHYTICPILSDEHSTEFPVEWINPDPNMTELEELRRRVNEWED